jgi:hypothetical protein
VNQLFVSVRGLGVSSALGGSVVGIEGTQSLRRASSIRRTFTTGTAGIKRKSVCLQVKFTVVGFNILLSAFALIGYGFKTLWDSDNFHIRCMLYE